ncbi:hypothetical protein BJX66DRAFT_299531 [Aspergillus keveii]|uniref:Secreted protein n=1 Tax=Aspergillus keveii TaxID=714993 RepID=A0ABR4GDJ5_9EURO
MRKGTRARWCESAKMLVFKRTSRVSAWTAFETRRMSRWSLAWTMVVSPSSIAAHSLFSAKAHAGIACLHPFFCPFVFIPEAVEVEIVSSTASPAQICPMAYMERVGCAGGLHLQMEYFQPRPLSDRSSWGRGCSGLSLLRRTWMVR